MAWYGSGVATVLERLQARSDMQPDGCWTWLGERTPKGYGRIEIAGRRERVHRVSWRIHVGPLGRHEILDHLCRNRACWNPSHLEQVTNRENILRGEGPTAENARKTRCVNGHELSPENLTSRSATRGWRECATCRQANRKAWKARQRGRGTPPGGGGTIGGG